MNILLADGLALRDAVRSRAVSAVEVTRASLEAAEGRPRELGAFTELLPDRALDAAKRLDDRLKRGDDPGPMTGIPVSVKDAIWVGGIRATNGSRAYEDFRAPASCASVDRLEAGGATVIGKTNNPEFCFFGYTDGPLWGPARNPWDETRTAGGSSGGAAASVVLGATPVALGSDGGGSIRGPASFCGTFGLKPTFGLVPQEPGFRGWRTLQVQGPLTRTAADAALTLTVLAGIHPADPFTADIRPRDYLRSALAPEPVVSRCRIAWSSDLGYAAVDPAVRRAFHAAIRRIEAAGIRLMEAAPPTGDPTKVWTDIAVCEGYAAFGGLLPAWERAMWPGVADIIRAGDRPTAEYIEALETAAAYARGWAAFFDDYDLLLTPMMQVPPFDVDVSGPKEIDGRPVDPFFDDWSNLCYPANLTGQPAASTPIDFTPDGLPVGMQIIGQRFRDDVVLAFAATCERIWPGRPDPPAAFGAENEPDAPKRAP
jgi:Asp-tRNA(Asn)/Glu-tRNA(Gln) amidotransferase A subunit family amidase